jgi:hypothetical protein
MRLPREGYALPERTVRGGAHLTIRVARRTVGYARPTAATRTQRIVALLLLVPVLAFMIAVAAILLAAMLIVSAVLAATLGMIAVFARRRLPRPR